MCCGADCGPSALRCCTRCKHLSDCAPASEPAARMSRSSNTRWVQIAAAVVGSGSVHPEIVRALKGESTDGKRKDWRRETQRRSGAISLWVSRRLGRGGSAWVVQETARKGGA